MPKKGSKKKLPVSKVIGENYDNGEPIPAPKVTEQVICSVTEEEQVLFTEEEAVEGESLELPEMWELDDVLLVCSQCGRAVRVPPLEKVPKMCACGLVYDHDHELTPTEIVIDEPTTLVVRKMARKW